MTDRGGGANGAVYPTYSAYARGLDRLNPAYQMLDITALGRQEGDLPYPTAWVKLHDEYAGWTSSPVGALFELVPKRQDIAQEAHAPEGCARERSKRGRE